MNPKKLMQYIHTARYLKFKQIIFRIYYTYRFLKIKPPEKQPIRSWQKASVWPSSCSPSLSETGEYAFLGEQGNINDPCIWSSPKHSKLWLYNLHYLNDLNAKDADLKSPLLNQLIGQWIENNPLCQGTGWEPYPLSLRIVNLVKWYSRHPQLIQLGWLENLSYQAEALARQIEYDILGNHVFANAKGLIFAGAFFEGEKAASWLKKGLRILDKEVEEQFLSDGAHFELSPMYHASLVWDMCDLVNLAIQSNLPELIKRQSKWQRVIADSLTWFIGMLHPDNDLSFFNDAAFGMAPSFIDITNYMAHLGIPYLHEDNKELSLQWFKESGYCSVHLGEGHKAILDLAEIGPRYQPGHAHADTLSFELSLHGQRFLVNSGISQYGESLERQFQRSTKAHNTVCINDMNSSEVWAGFRVARRAHPRDISILENSNRICIACSHDGYLRLKGKNIHRREWDFKKNSLTIQDKITGPFKSAQARYYLHPDIKIINVKEGSITCCFPNNKQVMINMRGAYKLDVEASNWHPAFGAAVANHCLVVTFKTNEFLTQIAW